MYRFKQLKAKYSFVSEVIMPSGERSIYSKIEHVSVLPNLVEGLNFTLKGATEELVNEKSIEGFDLIMAQLGHSLYPIELNVLKTGEIKRLKNFADIQSRWNKESKQMLSTYKNAYWVERYINMTSKNVVSEERFMNTLQSNNFIQLLLINEANDQQSITLSDFPHAGCSTDLVCDLISSKYGSYRYRAVNKEIESISIGQSEITISYTEKGLPENILFCCMAEISDEGIYTKRIFMKLIDVK